MAIKLHTQQQIDFVVEHLKPQLQENKIKDVRLFLSMGMSRPEEFNLEAGDREDIIYWLYKNLGTEEYFKNSTAIFPFEFEYLKDRTFTIPNTITTIYQYAFSNSNIRKIIIPKSVKSIGACAFCESEIQEVIFEDFSNVKLDSGVFVDSNLDIIYVEDNADESALTVFHTRIPYVTIVSSSTGEVLREAEN